MKHHMWTLPFFLLALVQSKDSSDLHCCFAPRERPVVLACDQYENDLITQVPFAYFGAVPFDQRVCGADADDGRKNFTGVHIQRHLQSTCAGQRSCEVQWSDFEHLCESCTELLVRWICKSDAERPSVPLTSASFGPLRASGNQLLDSEGNPVRLHGVNWPGMHITHVPSGLDRTPLESLVLRIKSLGFNMVRLTWDVNTVRSNPVVSKRLVAANPRLIGKRALDVMEEVFKSFEAVGLHVWLDNHMLDTDWCCNDDDCNGLWFNAHHTEEDWLDAWRRVAELSRPYKVVVAAGLKNEIRAMTTGKSWGFGAFCNASFFDRGHLENIGNFTAATWSSGPASLQWRTAAERAGRMILEVNPNLLISVGGLDYSSDLREFKELPNLPKEKLVLEAHSYSWQTVTKVVDVALPGQFVGPEPGQSSPANKSQAVQTCNTLGDMCGGVTCTGMDHCYARKGLQDGEPLRGAIPAKGHFSQIKRFKSDRSDFAERTDAWWGFLVKQDLVPVVLTEFGMAQDWHNDPTASLWFTQLSEYMAGAKDGGLDWMYWSLIGEQEGGTSRHAGQTETFGVLNHCNTAAAAASHLDAIQNLMAKRRLLV